MSSLKTLGVAALVAYGVFAFWPGPSAAMQTGQSGAILEGFVSVDRSTVSLDYIFNSADVVVEGETERVFPTHESAGGGIYADISFRVKTVFKGPASLSQLVFAQMRGLKNAGGGNSNVRLHRLYAAGERYLLFLVNDTQNDLPVRDRLPRYWILWVDNGAVRISDERRVVDATPIIPSLRSYIGKPLDDLISSMRRPPRR